MAIEEQLSADEVREAISFYESAAGCKYTDIQSSSIERPVEQADFTKAMTVDEALSFRKFFALSLVDTHRFLSRHVGRL